MTAYIHSYIFSVGLYHCIIKLMTFFPRLGGKRASDQDLDDESAAGLASLKDKDAEIDKGIEAIGNQIDTLNNIAKLMQEEVLLLCEISCVIC